MKVDRLFRCISLAFAVIVAGAGACGAALAAGPPTLINYQGVLRNSSTAPISGVRDMEFRFWSALTGGDEILIDKHLAANGQQVSLNGGLFSVQLGGGTVSDGSGPNTYTSLDTVFREYTSVYLAIRVGSEDLTPRMQIVASPYAFNTSYLDGKSPAFFLDSSSTVQTKAGSLIVTSGGVAVSGGGTTGGGFFSDSDNVGQAAVGAGDYGILAYGAYPNGMGGLFKDTSYSGEAWLADGNSGVIGYGNYAGGIFRQGIPSSYTSQAYLGWNGYGIDATGPVAGGHFKSSDQSGEAWVAKQNTGIIANGSTAGGEFTLADGSTYALLASGNIGVQAVGTIGGGRFVGPSGGGPQNSTAYLANGSTGISAYAWDCGGKFTNADSANWACVGSSNMGIYAQGRTAGGYFYDQFTWAYVAKSPYKITGNGSLAFVQNHPYEKDKVIVYNAPEGDEVAVYTRGSSRLTDGQARVELSETFALVANQDLGLTVQLTPVGDPVPLAIVEKSTHEIIVRGPAGSNAEFDYLVHGLRIGFERHATIQAKERDAFLPYPAVFDAQSAGRADLEASTAFSRFSAMLLDHGATLDLTRSRQLAASINENRDAIRAAERDAEMKERSVLAPYPASTPGVAEGSAKPSSEASPNPETSRQTSQEPQTTALYPRGAAVPLVAEARVGERIAISGEVESGEVLVLDRTGSGGLLVSSRAADPLVAGCAAPADGEGFPVSAGTHQVLASARIVKCKVDASFGAVAVGDLLTTSPSRGHAMRADNVPRGAILGRALEPLESGEGLVRVLVMLR